MSELGKIVAIIAILGLPFLAAVLSVSTSLGLMVTLLVLAVFVFFFEREV